MSSDVDGEPGSQNGAIRLPPLGALRCFEAAARLESFTRAAEALHLTHGAVSRAVRALEDDLGTALFIRRNRRVFLTEAGARLRDATAEAFAGILAATRELRQRTANAALVLSCEPTLLMRWLIPRLPGLQAEHPDLRLRLAAGGGPVAFERDGINLAIRRNDFPFPAHVQAAPFMVERVGPVCSPAYADAMRIEAPDATRLAVLPVSVTLLHTRTRPDAWPRWSALSGATLPPGPGQPFEHFYFSLQAAAAGLGLAIGPWALVRDDIAAGMLVAPFGFREDGSAYDLISPRPIDSDRDAQSLLTWLKAQA